MDEEKKKGISWTSRENECIKYAILCGQTIVDHVPLERKFRTDAEMRGLIAEASKLDLEPKPASLWWTSTYASEEKIDMNLGTTTGCYTFPFEDTFKILGCAMNRQGKTCDAVEERMQSANKAFWKDIVIFKSKDAPWKMKCQSLVDQVYAVFAFRSENWSWTEQTMEKSKMQHGQEDMGTDGIAFLV